MCVIVDANLCSVVFRNTGEKSHKNLRAAILSNRLTLVHGGKLTAEYKKAGVISTIHLLAQSGRAIMVSSTLIDAEIKKIEGRCKSNDLHVIALARVDRKRGRVLCTDDQALKADFKNKALIDGPRGKIYSPTRHKQSLANC